MRIVSFINGTVVYGAAWEEIRPLAGISVYAVIDALKEKYRFNQAGLSEAGQQAGFTIPHMQLGCYQGSDIGITSLEFQPQGIIVTCSTTDQAEKVLSDVLTFLKNSFGFRDPSHPRQKVYNSVVVSEFEFNIARTLDKWGKICELINAAMPAELPKLAPAGVKFVTKEGAGPSISFAVERRMGSPEGENWWFSNGPLDTNSHVKILEQIEMIWGGSDNR